MLVLQTYVFEEQNNRLLQVKNNLFFSVDFIKYRIKLYFSFCLHLKSGRGFLRAKN